MYIVRTHCKTPFSFDALNVAISKFMPKNVCFNKIIIIASENELHFGILESALNAWRPCNALAILIGFGNGFYFKLK